MSHPRLSAGESSQDPALSDGTAIHLPSLWRSVLRGWPWIVGVPLALAVLVAIWTATQPRLYEGRSSLLIEGTQGGGGFLAEQVAAFTGLVGPRSTLETDLRLLKSRTLVEGVVDSLALQVVVRSPDVPRSELFSHVDADRDAFSGTITLTPRSDGRYEVRVEHDPRFQVAAPSRVSPGERFEIGGVRLELSDSLAGQPGQPIELSVLSFRGATQGFLKELQIERAGGSSVVEAVYRHSDPVLAALAANTLVDRFIEYRLRTNQEAARGASDFLSEQVETYAQELRAAEARLQDFREQEAVLSPDAQASQRVQRLGALETRKADLVAERNVLARLVQEVSSAPPSQTSEYRKLAAFPEFFRNPAVQNILRSLVDLENERASLLVKRTEENTDVRGLTSRIEDLEEQLYLTARNYLASLDEQIAAIDRTLGESVSDAARVPAVQTEYVRLSREVELLDEIYGILQVRLKEQELAEADRRSDIRLVDAALIPLRPSSPRPVLNLAIALIIGTMLGLAIAIARAAFDPALYSREVAASVAGGVPILASIPPRSRASTALLPMGGNGRLRLPFARGPGRNGDARALARQGTAAAEAYASLRTRLSSATGPQPQVILVTSPREGDGKSTVAVNLATVFARHGSQTLLLEADLRNGDLGRMLAIDPPPANLSQVLAETAPLAAAIATYPVPGTGATMDVLLAGRADQHPGELLDSEAFGATMTDLRGRYEVIVVDSPPLGAVSDALLVGRFVDGALIVTRSGGTHRAALQAAVAELDWVGVRVLGLVLNGFPSEGLQRYAYQSG